MKKYSLTIYLVLCLAVSVNAQNLISNYSFETHSNCPTGFNAGTCVAGGVDQVAYAAPWFAPTCGTSDYFNSCGSMSVPNNPFGSQLAKTGEAYTGLYTYFSLPPLSIPTGDREYIRTPLNEALIPSKLYYVEFYASLADNSGYATADLGVYFSMQSLSDTDTSSTPHNIIATPQISNNNGILSDKGNWVKISGCYIADSAYGYITIGNFNGDATTTKQKVSGGVLPYSGCAYYYIDDVSLNMIDINLGNDTTILATDSIILDAGLSGLGAAYQWSTGATTQTIIVSAAGNYSVVANAKGCNTTDEINISIETISEMTLQIPNVYSPNGDGVNDAFFIKGSGYNQFSCFIFNRWGQKIYELNALSETWQGYTDSGEQATAGIYFYVINATDFDNKPLHEKGYIQLLRN